MGLPTIKVPKFTLNLPISKKSIKARPFLIKEQKMLLQALEVGDKDQVSLALDDIMASCTFGEIDIDMLPVPDVEYLMLNIRSKSVGDSIDMTYTCHNEVTEKKGEQLEQPESCNSKIKVKILIKDIKVKEFDDHPYKLIFDGGIGLELRDIPYGVYKRKFDAPETLEKTMSFRNSCIKSIFNDEEVWTRDQFTEKELEDFVENLYTTDYEKIEKFIKSMPILQHDIKITCPVCNHSETVTLKGLDDFLD